jgi:hypothetical protein
MSCWPAPLVIAPVSDSCGPDFARRPFGESYLTVINGGAGRLSFGAYRGHGGEPE